tara:strand:- start:1787 stop:1963 length:177 start_codon:yes stop_codon:yes gene_type:complete
MSGDLGLEQPIVFYSQEMTMAKITLLKLKGITLNYKINSQKTNDRINWRKELDKKLER